MLYACGISADIPHSDMLRYIGNMFVFVWSILNQSLISHTGVLFNQYHDVSNIANTSVLYCLPLTHVPESEARLQSKIYS